MAAATAQACEDRASTWHQDERVLGGAQGVEAIEALPTVLHIEHRRGRDPFRSRDVESVSLYAPVSMCMDAGGPMERLRALTSIPDGRTWCTR
jgi:hypothetical protein